MFTVGILYPAVICRIYTLCIFDLFTHGILIYTMHGLSALPVPTVGQCEGLGVWDGRQARFPRLSRSLEFISLIINIHQIGVL